jgi:hypothetical protein
MQSHNIQELSDHYRRIRKLVFEEATRPTIESLENYNRNKNKLKDKVTEICNKANLELYAGYDRSTAQKIWNHLWTKNRYAGIKAKIAAKEIKDIEAIFDQFEIFSNNSWDIEANGHEVIKAGESIRDFLNRSGIFENRQTIGNIPKLCKIVSIARKLKKFMENKLPKKPVLDFITDGHSENDVWSIHAHLINIGYTRDLTVLHFMMDMGFQVMKPDIIITRQFLEWGWLHYIINDLPVDLTSNDLEGKGKYGSKFRYINPIIYKPVIELAKMISEYTNQEKMRGDIGWVTKNRLREFDIFIVKYGQQPEEDFGITKTLFKRTREMTHIKDSCITRW